jgi:hypothetical protein
MRTINNWMIIQLTHLVLNGNVDGFNTYTDKVLLVKDGYAVTQHEVLKLGSPDKVWITTSCANQYIQSLG